MRRLSLLPGGGLPLFSLLGRSFFFYSAYTFYLTRSVKSLNIIWGHNASALGAFACVIQIELDIAFFITDPYFGIRYAGVVLHPYGKKSVIRMKNGRERPAGANFPAIIFYVIHFKPALVKMTSEYIVNGRRELSLFQVNLGP